MADEHTIRCLLPQDAPRRIKVYIDTGNGWQPVSSDTAGSYLRFQMPDSGTFVITEDTSTPLWVWIASGGAALLALCAVLLIHKARKKKRKAA